MIMDGKDPNEIHHVNLHMTEREKLLLRWNDLAETFIKRIMIMYWDRGIYHDMQ